MTDVTFSVLIRFLSLWFICETNREHTGKNRKDKYCPQMTWAGSDIQAH